MTNGIYWPGKFATIFLDSQPNKITLKVKKKFQDKFKTIKWICFSTKSGKIRVYHWSRRQGIKDITYSHKIDIFIRKLCKVALIENYGLPKSELAKNLSILLNKEVDESSIYNSIATEVMPLLNEYDVFEAIPYKLREGFKNEKLAQAVKAWFGRDNKQLVRKLGTLLQSEIICDKRYLGQHKLNWLALVKLLFDDWSNIDYTYKLLEIEPLQWSYINPNQVYNLLKIYSPKSVIRLLNKREAVYLGDAGKMYHELLQAYPNYKLLKRPRSSQELHDYLVRDYNRLKVEQTPSITLPTEKLGHLNGAKINDNLQVSIPKNSVTLIQWGHSLRQCVAAYKDKVISKQCYIIGIVKAEVIKYCVEVNHQGEIIQFSGYRNCFPEPQDWLDVMTYLARELHKVFKPQFQN